MSFTKQLKLARTNIGYTQQQIADAMGITKSTYCGYETGKRQPDVPKLKQLAHILNISADTLLETNYKDTYNSEASEISISEKKIKLIRLILNMQSEQIVVLYNFINSIYKKEDRNNNLESNITSYEASQNLDLNQKDTLDLHERIYKRLKIAEENLNKLDEKDSNTL